MAAATSDLEQQLADRLVSFRHDPVAFADYAYPWSRDEGLRKWQRQILCCIRDHLQNPATRYTPLRIAVSSGHGIGKSAEVGIVLGWALSTCFEARATITANTGDQLSSKTVPECKKWFQQLINAHWWEPRAETIRAKEPECKDSWGAHFLTWSLERTEAFAGLHNEGKRIVLIFDEASAIPDKIWEVAEGALTDAKTEILWLAFGNPTKNTGRFRECFGKFAHRWKTFQIDSRTVEGTNKDEIQKWAEDYGEDSDFFRVRVRGEFPRAGSNQFISSESVAQARKYVAQGYEKLPKILAVDAARFGDDRSVIGYRQGRKAVILGKYRGLDTVQLAERTIEFIRSEKPDATVVDGDGIGAGVVDHIRHRNYGSGLHEFHGGAVPRDPQMYFNKRAEVWGLMRDWIHAGAQIPDDPEIEADLTGPEYGFSNKQQIQLEKKEDMKKRGLASPDIGDMLAMTFAVQVAPKPTQEYRQQSYGEQGWMA